jgi:hypothetical protein
VEAIASFAMDTEAEVDFTIGKNDHSLIIENS